MTTETKNPPGFLFQLTCDCGNGKTIAVSGNWSADVGIEKINGDIDLINQAFDRQRAKHEAPLIEERIEGTENQMVQLMGDMEIYDKQHPPGAKHRSEEHVNKMRAQLASLKVAIARGEVTLAETRQRAK